MVKNLSYEHVKNDDKLRKECVKGFCTELANIYSENTVTMSTSILASLILTFREGVSEEALKFWYPKIHEWIGKKGGHFGTR